MYNSVGLVVASSYSDSTGLISGFMPNGEACVLKFITDCNNILGGANVGPNLAKSNSGISSLPADLGLTVKGTVVTASITQSPVAL